MVPPVGIKKKEDISAAEQALGAHDICGFCAVDEQALTGRAAWGVLGSAAGGHVLLLWE
jgi:hypothetical protein